MSCPHSEPIPAVDADLDQRAYSAAALRGTGAEASAREDLLAAALSHHIFHQALDRSIRRMGLAPAHLQAERLEYLTNRLSDRLVRCIVGNHNGPPLLDLNLISDGVRFSTWLRRMTYPSMHQLEVDAIRSERVRRKVQIATVDAADQPVVTSPEDTLLRRRSENLWESFLVESAAAKGKMATLSQAWYLSTVLGLRELSSVDVTRGQLRLSDDLDPARIRRYLKLLAHGQGHAAADLEAALTVMTAGHSQEDLLALAGAQDVVLTHLVRAALTPTPPLPRADVQALRDAATALVYPPGHLAPGSRPVRYRAINSLVSAWGAYIAKASTDAPDSPLKDPAQMDMEKKTFVASVEHLLACKVTVFGADPDEVSHYLDSLLRALRNDRRSSGHTT